MENQGVGFRQTWFGGFDRADVLKFIEETDKKYHEETAALRSELTAAQDALKELRMQNDALTVKDAELLERLGEMTLETDRFHAKLTEIEQGFTLQAQEIEAQNERAAELAAENARLMEENARLSEKCGEYDASKDKIAEMELAAYRRAKKIEENARTEQQRMRQQTVEMIEQVQRQLDETKENYRQVLNRNQQDSAELARRAGAVISEIDRLSASLNENDKRRGEDDKQRSSLRDMLNGLRPRTEE